MAEKKLTTAEILAQLRKQDSGDGGSAAPSTPTAEASQEEAAPATEASSAESKPAAPAAKPGSTADILAAARAQAAGGSAAPKASAAGSTSDKLAAARAQGAGGAAKPKAAGKPSSTADILAAARAGAAGGGGASKPAAGKAAPAKTAAAKAAPVPAAGDRPSVAEMVKAAREGKPLEERSAATAAKPKLPARPPVSKVKKSADDPARRGFLAAAIVTLCTPYYLAWSVLALIGGVWSLAVARFMMPNMIVEPPTRFKIGPPSDYPMGTVSTKWKAERGIWVVHTDSYDGRNLLYALASVCTHLGCTPNWLEGEQKFKCPCHGSGFYINGVNFEGPAPRPLERVGVRLAEDGSLEVDKSVKFQEELGQWQDGASFVELA